MPVSFQCPRCERLLSTATRKAGRLVVCPGCDGPVVVPLLSRPVFSRADGGLKVGRLALVSGVVALLAALAIPAGEGLAELTTMGVESDAAVFSAPAAAPVIDAEQAVQPPAPESATVVVTATAAETNPTVLPQPAPYVVFVPVPVPEPIAVAVAPPVPPIATPPAPGGACGTGMDFERTPLLASEKARKERKLLMLLHISGNFEEARFT